MKKFKKAVAIATAAAIIVTALPEGKNVQTVQAASAPDNLKAFSLDEVTLSDVYYKTAEESDIEFLSKFDVGRMLSRFRETAGLDTQGYKPYKGWEDSYLGGHCVGHYLSAAAQAVKATGNEDLKGILEEMIDGLKECQDNLGTGFIFGAKIQDPNNVEKQFNIVEGKDSGETWVPWYNMHKILTGLLDVYKLTDNAKALDVAKGLGDWIHDRVMKWDQGTQNRILGTEYGGMNDCLYELYALTGDDKYSDAAHKFDDPNHYKTVLSGKADTLNGRHANATIPKFLGALNRYITMGDEEYLEYAEDFWELVVSKHAYATGGVSDMEHFRKDEQLDATRTQCNCESCCAHNLLRITRELFMITGDVKYADYYENTLRNAIMGAIDTEKGNFSYFTPMATGYFKFFGQGDPAENMFWCCTGTGMENYTKLGDSIYFHNDDSVVVAQYVASKLNWKEKGIIIDQNSDVTASDTAEFTITTADGSAKNFNIYLRVPEWISGSPHVTVNGSPVEGITAEGGFLNINRSWNNNDKLTIKYPMTVKAVGLPDNDTVYAFRYGPTLLAARLGSDHMDLNNAANLTWAGANLSAPKFKVVGSEECQLSISYNQTSRQVLGSETLSIEDSSLEQYMKNIADNMVKVESPDGLEFKLTGTDADDNFDGGLTFVPFNTLNDERYGIYWYFSALSQEELEKTILANKEEGRFASNTIDSIMPGYGQYEKDVLHDMQESNSVSGTDSQGRSTRHAAAGGYFSYNMKVRTDKTNSLRCKFMKEDNGKTIKISVGDKVIATDTLNYTGEDVIYSKDYEIPADVVTANVTERQIPTDAGGTETVNTINIKFESSDSADSARLIDGLYMAINYNNNASITEITSNTGTVKNEGDVFTIEVPDGTQVVKANITLGDKFGLLYINDVLVNDGKAQALTVNGANGSFKLKAFAEDHATSKEYTLNIVQTLPSNATDTPANPTQGPGTQPGTTTTTPTAAPQATQPVTNTPAGTTGTQTDTKTTANKKASIKITGKKTVKVGKSIKLKAKLTNVKGTVKWSVNKKKIATINAKTGKLKGKKAGKVKVTAKVKKVKATVTIKVKK
jgi:hypothetical protein